MVDASYSFQSPLSIAVGSLNSGLPPTTFYIDNLNHKRKNFKLKIIKNLSGKSQFLSLELGVEIDGKNPPFPGLQNFVEEAIGITWMIQVLISYWNQIVILNNILHMDLVFVNLLNIEFVFSYC